MMAMMVAQMVLGIATVMTMATAAAIVSSRRCRAVGFDLRGAVLVPLTRNRQRREYERL
jgi:hypothetical protein